MSPDNSRKDFEDPRNATGSEAHVRPRAALALRLRTRRPWPERHVEGVALSAAALQARLPGDFDPEVYRDLRDTVTGRRLSHAPARRPDWPRIKGTSAAR